MVCKLTFFFFQAEDGIRDLTVTGVQTCALPIFIPGSEIMAIMALATGIEDLEQRLARIIVGLTSDKHPVRASDLKAQGAMTLLLKDAINPNLVQTLEGGPAFIHCGPFGNIAHGCNSVVATRLALTLCDVVLTEAGF